MDNNEEKSKWWSVLWRGCTAFAAACTGIYGILEFADYFGFSVKDIIEAANPDILLLIFCMMIALIAALTVSFRYMLSEGKRSKKDESILSILESAVKEQRKSEILKIGPALSDFLWYTGRKELRIKVGQIVEVTARETQDYEILARTFIEDIGNTMESIGKIDEGIRIIERGIVTAEQHDLPFLKLRGYCHLASAYCARRDAMDKEKAESALANADSCMSSITKEDQKQEAVGSVEYARAKFYLYKNEYDKSIESLDKSIAAYNKITELHPETKKINKDRIVKILRQKGVVYLTKNNEESTDKAIEFFTKGLRLAKSTDNYENIVVTSNYLAEIYLKRNIPDSARANLKVSKEFIKKIETPKIKAKYKDLSKQLRKA